MRVVQMNAFSQPQRNSITVNAPSIADNKSTHNSSFNVKKLLDSFQTDDYILAGLLLVLIFEGCDDYILLAALGYLFIMGLV